MFDKNPAADDGKKWRKTFDPINNLSGAFLVLFIGFVLSIIAFILELNCKAWRQRRLKNKTTLLARRKSQLHHLKPIAITVATAAKVETSDAVSTALNVVSIVVPKTASLWI